MFRERERAHDRLVGPIHENLIRQVRNNLWQFTATGPDHTLETQRINHTAMLSFIFYTYRKRQSVIFALNPAFQCRNLAFDG
jgi:hypothetical protein